MHNNKINTSIQTNTQSKPLLKIAIDAHLAWHVIAIQEEGSSPKPQQRFKPADLLKWIGQKIAAGWSVVTCYQAGPFGYVLHRQLTGLGATNYVIRPRNWDEQHTRVKTDRTDALAMLNALDRFCADNPKALALVRVPSDAEERLRSQSRLRQSLQRDLKMIAQRGRGLALQYGYRLKGKWYGRRNWPKLEVPAWLIELVKPAARRGAGLARTGARGRPANRGHQHRCPAQRHGRLQPAGH